MPYSLFVLECRKTQNHSLTHSNPAYTTVFNPNYAIMYSAKPNAIPPFGIRIAPLHNGANIDLTKIDTDSVSSIAPWQLKQPRVLFTLHAGKKADTNPSAYLSAYNELVSKFSNYIRIYTDSSKDGDKAVKPLLLAIILPASDCQIILPFSQLKGQLILP